MQSDILDMGSDVDVSAGIVAGRVKACRQFLGNFVRVIELDLKCEGKCLPKSVLELFQNSLFNPYVMQERLDSLESYEQMLSIALNHEMDPGIHLVLNRDYSDSLISICI